MSYLVVLGALLIYLLVSVAVVRGAVRYAKNKGKKSRRWFWGAVLVMYLIPFWDLIPTVVVHQYYCSTEAGFWVYKTVDQWKAENPGVLETLVSNQGRIRNHAGDPHNWTRTTYMNQRFVYLTEHNGPLPFNRWKIEQKIVDQKTGEVLVRSVRFSTSQQPRDFGWSGWKFWLDVEECRSYSRLDSGSISAIEMQLKGK